MSTFDAASLQRELSNLLTKTLIAAQKKEFFRAKITRQEASGAHTDIYYQCPQFLSADIPEIELGALCKDYGLDPAQMSQSIVTLCVNIALRSVLFDLVPFSPTIVSQLV